MKLIEYLNERQLKLCQKADVIIENKEYDTNELLDIEQRLLNYLNLYCVDNDDEVTDLGEEYEDLIDRVVDFEDELDGASSFIESYIEEDDKVKLKDGRTGTLVDITENMYTVEIDENFKTGDSNNDIAIVEITDIVSFIKPTESIENIDDENRNKIDDDIEGDFNE